MKKLFLSVLIIIIVSTPAFSQEDKKFFFSIGAELSFATGSFSDRHSFGTGATAQAEFYIMDKLKGTTTFGVLVYRGKSVISGENTSAQTVIPLRVGAKYFLSGQFYGAAQMGVAFLSSDASGTAFAYSPLMFGYEFKTKSENIIDVTIKYDAYTGSGAIGTIGALGFRLAYVF